MNWLRSLGDSSPGGQGGKRDGRQAGSTGARRIADLGTTHADLRFSDIVQNRDGLQADVQGRSDQRTKVSDADTEQGWLRFPFQIHISRSCKGQPDLRLQLLQVQVGAHKGCPEHLGAQLDSLEGVGNIVSKAASITFLRLTFPETVDRAGSAAAIAGFCLVAGSGAARAVSHSLPHASKAAQKRVAAAKASCRRKLKQQNLHLKGLSNKAGEVGQWVEHQICHPAAALAVAGIMWSCLHPASFHVARCLAAAIPVQAGYAATTRQTARGQLVEGAGMEEAWRRRHRWAACKLAQLQTDLYDSPPLAPAYSVLETVSLSIGTLLDATNAAHGAWSQPSSSQSLTLIGSVAAGGTAKPPPPALGPPTIGNQAVSEHPRTPAVVGDASPEPRRFEHSRPAVTPVGHSPATEQAGLRPGRRRFIPASCEDFETSRLPTIRSRSELEAVCASGISFPVNGGMPASPFETAASQPHEESPAAVPATQALVPFSSAELDQLDTARGHVDTEGLDLYGRGDHLQLTPEPTTLLNRGQMTIRAFYLIMVFLPFILLGPLLLYLGSLTARRKPGRGVTVNGGAPGSSGAAHRAGAAAAESDEKAPAQYGGGLAPEAAHEGQPRPQEEETISRQMRLAAWQLLLMGIRASGAAFIKWGQWSSTREDMFPAEFCSVLAELHDKAPEHSWRASKREIEAVFGKSVEELFDTIDHKALASGSIAQVHKAVMQVNGKPRSVVVKVRHPKVAERLTQDFKLLIPLAGFTSRVRSLKGLSLKSSLEQFSATMTAQTDLRVESAHLRRFFTNFASVRSAVTPPFPLPGFETESVLIETFEAGHSVARYIANPAPCNTQIVALGVDAYLKMLLKDNFVHTDLHPGNILVRRRQPKVKPGKVLQEQSQASVPEAKQPLQLVLLDFGLAEELNATVRRHFISLLHMIGKGDGQRAAYHLLRMGRKQACPNPPAFVDAVVELYKDVANIHAPGGIDLDLVMKASLQLARQHEVTIDSSYAALVVGVCVIVGFATSLDPGLNLMDAATPAFVMANLTGRIIGRLYA